MIYIFLYDDMLYANEFYNKKIKINSHKNTAIYDFNNNKNLLDEFQQFNLFNDYDSYKVLNCSFLTNSIDFVQNINLIKYINESIDVFYLFISNKLLINKEIKSLLTNYELIDTTKMTNSNKKQIINSLLKKYNVNLSTNINNYLIECLPNNFSIIKNEIRKIANITKKDCSDQDIKDIVCDYTDTKIFDLLDLLLFNKQNQFWISYGEILNASIDQVTLINTIYSQLLNIYIFKKMLETTRNYEKINCILGLHPYVLTIYKNKYLDYNIKYILTLIDMLYEIDIKIKRSIIDKQSGLKILFINFFKELTDVR